MKGEAGLTVTAWSCDIASSTSDDLTLLLADNEGESVGTDCGLSYGWLHG